MRKKIWGILGFAGLMLAAPSCSDDLKMNVGGEDGDIVQVTFTLSKEGAVGTRADGNVHYPEAGQFPQISDGSKAKRLVWAVYDVNGNLLPEIANNYKEEKGNQEPSGLGQVVEDVEAFPHTITLSLVRGQEYSFAFWAQDENCNAYNTNDLRAVSIDYKSNGNNLANDELRDAFCKVETFTVSSAASMERTIILRRPFAQVNVGIPASEYEALRRSGIRIKKSMIHFENVATVFDVVANSTNGDDDTKRQAIDYSVNWIPAYYNYNIQNESQIPTDEQMEEDQGYSVQHNTSKVQYLKIDLNKDGEITPYGKQNGEGEDETYNYMLMAYILPADRNDGTSTYSTTLDKVSFSLIPEDDGQQPLTMELENVPVQRNWRTNIFGRMFTSEVKLNIDLDPFYAGDYNYPEWERIYEGVYLETTKNSPATRDASEDNAVIHISNGAGLIWLSNATNGVWETEQAFIEDDTHNKGANLKNSADLMLKAAGLEEWPKNGLFRFKGVTIKLDSDIDLDTYAAIFGEKNKEFYFTPIGFGGDDEFNHKLDKDTHKYFGGHFDGQNHTIYNLKTVRPKDGNDNSSMGLFSTIGREASIRNVRLKNVDIRGHYRTGGIVGFAYGPIYPDSETPVVIDNCYVDSGIIEATTNDDGKNAKDVAGICGLLYNNGTISKCFVRNLIIRGYRTISGIIGQTGGDYANDQQIVDNSVFDVTLIADWFQYKDQGKSDYEIESAIIGEAYYPITKLEKNQEGNNKIYAFWWKTIDGKKITEIGRSEDLDNPPLDIFPRMAYFTDKVHFTASILGGPSAWKKYDEDDEPKYKGVPDMTSGRVGLWVSGILVDGDGDGIENTLDNATITASDINDDNDCVVFVKDEATLKNITFHGATYAGQAICLAPVSGKTITLDNVLAYDAKKVLTDDGGDEGVSGGKLTVVNSNFRGYVKLSKGYKDIIFKNTTFDGSTKRSDYTTINKVEIGAKAAFENCKFLVEAGNNYIIDVADGSIFTGCKAYVIGKTGETEGVDVPGNCTISVGDDGSVVVE